MKWEEIGTIRSSSSSTRYAIDVNEDGDLRCRCASYIHNQESPKRCKHTDSQEAGTLLRAYYAKRTPARRNLGQVAGPFRKPYGDRLTVSGIAYPVSEDTVLVNRREFLQAQRIIAEAWTLVRSARSYAYPALQESLEELGRP